MLDQISLSPQVKQSMIISNKHGSRDGSRVAKRLKTYKNYRIKA